MNPALLQLIIAGVVPIIIFLAKAVAPKIPKPLLPPLAGLLGAALDWAGSLTTDTTPNFAVGAVSGLAGVGLREIVDQVKKGLTGESKAPLACLLALALPALLLLQGCGFAKAWKTGGDALVQEFATIAEGATQAGTMADLAMHPEHRTIFLASQAALSSFVAGAGTDANSLYGALAALQPLIPALRGTQGAVILAGAIRVFDAVTGWEATVDSSTAVQTISRAILRGLDAGLAAAPVVTSQSAARAAPKAAPEPLVPTRRIKL